ncbi:MULTISPECIES: endo-1,4-beta-xylanase [unclassified Streptomyces]|uniref:endo-1,4-beta-xylanase n=1 Tax=unclassified Streptomyces TaxID=2593676 RepID=UPI002E2A5D33|nr:endo-1,4-beta-xylanase [Streptomyces sp. NBC_01429]
MRTAKLRALPRAVVPRAATALTALTALAVAMVGLAAPAHAADPVLRDLATAKGRYYGTAVTASKLTGTYGSITGAQFNSITPGNEMKWGSVEPTRGSFSWSGADRVVSFAEANGQKVRGHTLVWHSQMPNWLADGTFSDTELRTIMNEHVTTEAARYKGRIDHWDVVNEPLNEDGTMRASKFYTQLGESYIADAFRSARAADPAAKLYINDYNTDGTGAKSNGMYSLVQRLKAQGVPIDGVGFQGHLILGQVPSTLQANLQRFADLGVDVAITELDIRMTLPATDAKLAQQKDEFKAVTNACLAVTRCAGVTAWGFTDADSWIPDVFPGQGAATPYDENFQPKPAYYGIAEALGWTGDSGGGGGGTPTTGCAVTYGVQSQWNTGFTANVTVRNTGTSPVSGWTVRWTWPSGQSVSSAWNATVTQSGTQVTAVNASHNAAIAAGGSVDFGFNGAWSGANPAPAAFTLNGAACTTS